MGRLADSIAILATGSEIIQGQVLNTNTATIATLCHESNLPLGTQMTTGDDVDEMSDALFFLLKQHQTIITIGGLGPTSDDLTRVAIAKVVNQPLVFHEPSWLSIVERLQGLSLPITDNNRQQCYFPEGANVIENHYGTANACRITFEGKSIIMLPGPPRECLPLFREVVLPHLVSTQSVRTVYRERWLLLGESESNIASLLDPIVQTTDVKLAYRACSPYLEIKLSADQKAIFESVSTHLSTIIQKHCANILKEMHSKAFFDHIQQRTNPLTIIDDTAEQALLEALRQHGNLDSRFIDEAQLASTRIHFRHCPVHEANERSIYFELSIHNGSQFIEKKQYNIQNRGHLSPILCAELACQDILQLL